MCDASIYVYNIAYIQYILFGISLMINDADNISCTCWPFSSYSFENVHSSLWLNILLGYYYYYYCYYFALQLQVCILYLNIDTLSDVWVANIFSLSIDSFFTLLLVSFAVWKFFSLMQSHLLIFAFVVFAFFWVSHPKNHCQDQCQGVFSCQQ